MQRGFTLTELVIACAIAAMLMLAAVPAALGTKPAAAATGALALDAALSKAQAVAATSGNGATLQFEAGQSGTNVRVYSGRPDAAGTMTQAAPDSQTSASVTEAVLGSAPFAVFFDSSGHASAMTGTVDPSAAVSSDPGCPGPGAVVLTVSDGRSSTTRTLPCRQ